MLSNQVFKDIQLNRKKGDFNDSIHNKCSPGEHLHNHGNENDHYLSLTILLCPFEEYYR